MDNNENEVIIEHVIYAFASAGLARAFHECLNTGTVASCQLNHPPIAIYPPSTTTEGARAPSIAGVEPKHYRGAFNSRHASKETS